MGARGAESIRRGNEAMEEISVAVVVATHGDLGEALVRTTDMILGRKSALQPFSFRDGEAPKDSFKRLQNLIKKCNKGEGVIILVDLFGGTPGSMALSMLDDEQVEVVTGVNLPMAIAAATLDPKARMGEASAAIVKAGKVAIKEAGRLLKE